MGAPTPQSPVVRVWLHPVPAEVDRVDRFEGILTRDEIDRALHRRRASDRVVSLESAAMLRVAIGSELGVPARDVVITRDCPRCGDPTHGKPRLAGGLNSLSFNMSHTAGLVVLALGQVEVGVDVERVGGSELSSSIAAWLSADEVVEFDKLPRTSREEWLLQRWTAKEAYLKGTGVGLAGTPTAAEIDQTVGEHPSWNALLVDGRSAGWHVLTLDVGVDHVGSLAVIGPPVPVSTAAWEPPW
jgi:4'-phosphopantetheinyl transferase